ncbi:MAG: glutamate--tRNA ligase, partial [Deltaproteobacteria bacterium]|nr:glutamate--tRNA ligase [Deltaproteobacteria bacterium]
DEGPDMGGEYGPYIQSERKKIYCEHAQKLVESDKAYYCFCDKERLNQVREQCRIAKIDPKYDGHCRQLSPEEVHENLEKGKPFVIRQKMPTTGATTFNDTVFGNITVEHTQLDDQILIKADGLPTYNFANVIDDHLMKITHIIRGSEFLTSTPKYTLLYQEFGWEIPTYVHVPPVLKTATQKMSKRLGDASYEDFSKKGYLKGALINYIALLGWNPGDEREIFSLAELVQAFDVKDINKSPAIFDEQKLSWLSGEYIKKLSLKEFHQMALPYLNQTITRRDIDLWKISQLLQPRIDKLTDIPGHIDFIDSLPEYSFDLYSHKKMKSNPESSLKFLKLTLPVLTKIENWTEEAIHGAIFDLIKELGVKTGQILWPLRVALSGKKASPGGGIELAYLLGKEETVKRIEIAQEGLNKYLNF